MDAAILAAAAQAAYTQTFAHSYRLMHPSGSIENTPWSLEVRGRCLLIGRKYGRMKYPGVEPGHSVFEVTHMNVGRMSGRVKDPGVEPGGHV